MPDPLFPEEEYLVRRAVLKRRNEFALARTCARRALTNIGVAPCSILSTSDREPVWPQGLVGIDAEINSPLPDGVLAVIASPAERSAVAQLTDALPDHGVCWDRLLFSAKESVFKAWFPIAKRWLDFRDAEVTIDPVGGTFAAELLVDNPPTGRWLNGRFGLSGSHLLSAVLLRAS